MRLIYKQVLTRLNRGWTFEEESNMGMTMTQKILAEHAGLESVEAGQLIKTKLDMSLEMT
jgi:aconitase B